jgi:formylglycine-generating enzyme required for sulfatase activity
MVVAVAAALLFVALIFWISLGAKLKDEKKKTGLKEIKAETPAKLENDLCSVTLPALRRERWIKDEKGEGKIVTKEVAPILELVKVEAGSFLMSDPVTRGGERTALRDSKYGREVFMDGATGRCALFDAKTGKYTDGATGKVVDAEKVKGWKKLYAGNEIPHEVGIAADYYIGKTEVTQLQWMAVMGVKDNGAGAGKAKKSYFLDKAAEELPEGSDDLPVEMVTWNEAMNFCERLNQGGFAPEGWMFTLPTETQWEFAARGGKKSRGSMYSGSGELTEVAWCKANVGEERKNHPVAQKKPNELGLYDMNGNVWEWCLDDYVDDSSQCVPEFTRGNDKGGIFRVMRGGSWYTDDAACTPTVRSSMPPAGFGLYLGFRIALVKKPAK